MPFPFRLPRSAPRRVPRWLSPAVMLAVIVLAAVAAPWISPQDPYDLRQIRLADAYLPPVWSAARESAPPPPEGAPRFRLGADSQGRDVFSAVLYGLRVSLWVGASGAAIALVVGVALGLVAGYFGGRADAAIMRLADMQLAFPSVLIALFLMALLGSGLGKIVLAVAVVHWVIYARLARGMVLAEREKDYVAAAATIGARAPSILLRHLLPNVAAPILVVFALQFASIVMLEAMLSYLGLGVPITRPSLGMLIKLGHDDFLSGSWWVWFFPGAALVALVVSVNWLGDALREGKDEG